VTDNGPVLRCRLLRRQLLPGSQAVTGVGFAPKIVLFFTVGEQMADSTSATRSGWSMGVASPHPDRRGAGFKGQRQSHQYSPRGVSDHQQPLNGARLTHTVGIPVNGLGIVLVGGAHNHLPATKPT
jgi:hypothetical protein